MIFVSLRLRIWRKRGFGLREIIKGVGRCLILITCGEWCGGVVFGPEVQPDLRQRNYWKGRVGILRKGSLVDEEITP